MSDMMEDEKMLWHKRLTEIIYVLYALSLLVGITGIVAIVMNYIKRQEVKGTYLGYLFGEPFSLANSNILVCLDMEFYWDNHLSYHYRLVCLNRYPRMVHISYC